MSLRLTLVAVRSVCVSIRFSSIFSYLRPTPIRIRSHSHVRAPAQLAISAVCRTRSSLCLFGRSNSISIVSVSCLLLPPSRMLFSSCSFPRLGRKFRCDALDGRPSHPARRRPFDSLLSDHLFLSLVGFCSARRFVCSEMGKRVRNISTPNPIAFIFHSVLHPFLCMP